MTVRFKTTTPSLESAENALASLESAIASLEDYNRAVDIAVSVEAFDLKGVGEKVGKVLKDLWDKIVAMVKRFIDWITRSKSPEQVEAEVKEAKAEATKLDPAIGRMLNTVEILIVPKNPKVVLDHPPVNVEPPSVKFSFKEKEPTLLALPHRAEELYNLGSSQKAMTFSDFCDWLLREVVRLPHNDALALLDTVMANNSPHLKPWLAEFKRFYNRAIRAYGVKVDASARRAMGVGLLAYPIVQTVSAITVNLNRLHDLLQTDATASDFEKAMAEVDQELHNIAADVCVEMGDYTDLIFDTDSDSFKEKSGTRVLLAMLRIPTISSEDYDDVIRIAKNTSLKDILFGKIPSYIVPDPSSRSISRLNSALDKFTHLDIKAIEKQSKEIPATSYAKMVSELTTIGILMVKHWVTAQDTVREIYQHSYNMTRLISNTPQMFGSNKHR